MRVRSMVGLIPAVRRGHHRAGGDRRAAGIPPPHGLVHEAPAGPVRQHRVAIAAGRGIAAAAESAGALPAASACWNACWMRPSFFRRTAFAPFRNFTQDHPFVLQYDGQEYRVDYEPAESRTGLFGGNSNWRGPVWFPVNYLLIESLQRYQLLFRRRSQGGVSHRLRPADESWAMSPRIFAPPVADFPARRERPPAGLWRQRKSSRPIRIFATTSGSTNISTATTARASAPAIRPAGPRWSPSCSSRAGSSSSL